MMEYRNKANAKPSLLGLGCMRLPKADPDKDDIDYPAAQAIVDAAIAGGVTYFDTAYFYHGGGSEKFVGQALSKYPRESYYLATKMPLWGWDTPEEYAQTFENQLKNCCTEYFDFYLFHAVNLERYNDAKAKGLHEFLQKQKDAGRIRRLGFSFHDTPEALATVCADRTWDFAQLQLNYLDWSLQRAEEQYKILERHNIPCIVMEPVRGGALADLGEDINPILKAVNPQQSIASWAVRWVAQLPNVMTILSGMSSLEQLQDNLATCSPLVPFSAAENKALQEALSAYKARNLVPCTGCRYCMDCPCGVDIPLVFKGHNNYALQKNKLDFVQAMEKARPEACMACGACVDKCPQSINIPQKMQSIEAMTR